MTSSSAAVTLRVAESSDAICIAVLATQVFLDMCATEGIRPEVAAVEIGQLTLENDFLESALGKAGLLTAKL